MTEFLGLCRLNDRIRDKTLSASFEGLLPRDNPRNSRFAINFFTSIGLGGLTDSLREFLRTQVSGVPRLILQVEYIKTFYNIYTC